MFRIKVPTITLQDKRLTEKDVGLYGADYLDNVGEEKICDFCHEPIKDKKLFAIITEKDKNYKFHPGCYSQVTWDRKIYESKNSACKSCDHAYDRHFDGYEDQMDPDGFFFAGCKYCNCGSWVPKDDWEYPHD